MIARRKFYRILFTLAGFYNLIWASFSTFYPQAFFEFAGLPPINHPEIYICLAMVVGIYGFLYWEVARVPERGGAIVAVGLLGKVLGPLGALYLVWKGIWPAKAFLLNLGNDLIWWVPFALYLYDWRRFLKKKPIS